MNSAALTAPDLEDLIRTGVPMVGNMGVRVQHVEAGQVRLALPRHDDFVRPGGTIGGPVMFALADVALYGAVLSLIGRVELAVTTSMTINFLRRPPMRGLLAEGRILKMGQRLAYGEVLLFSEEDPQPIAHATGTYSIPPHPRVEAPPPAPFAAP
ncbi:thioesterase superfamily protein [mine drainage metagenome]|uniref:Thioesterase superfamily protein n=1 Tax=mine drainage metagenome TaxID=410659 RepID=A0A1J5R5N9_9ZZZZ